MTLLYFIPYTKGVNFRGIAHPTFALIFLFFSLSGLAPPGALHGFALSACRRSFRLANESLRLPGLAPI